MEENWGDPEKIRGRQSPDKGAMVVSRRSSWAPSSLPQIACHWFTSNIYGIHPAYMPALSPLNGPVEAVPFELFVLFWAWQLDE